VAAVVGVGGLLFLTFFLMGARWDVRKVEVDSLGGLLLGAVEVEEEEWCLLVSSTLLSSSSSPAFFMTVSKKLFIALLGLGRLRDRELTVVVVGRGFAAEVEEEEEEEEDVWREAADR
jgi:hypothetical protein